METPVPESTSPWATPVANINNEDTPYNLRRSYRSHTANIRRAYIKYGNKQFIIDKSRRNTYKEFHPSNYAQNHSLLSNFDGERKKFLAANLSAEERRMCLECKKRRSTRYQNGGKI